MMTDTQTTFAELRDRLEAFNEERGWNESHNLNMLAKSVTVEGAELINELIWLKDEEIDTALQEDSEFRHRVQLEVVDILYNVMDLSRILKMDLCETLEEKLKDVAKRYPAKS